MICHTTIGIGEPVVVRTPVFIEEGNYSTLGLPNAVAKAISIQAGLPTTATVSPITGIVTFEITAPNLTDIIQIIWVDITNSIKALVNSRYNSSLGWMLGFRAPITTFTQTPNPYVQEATPISPVDASGTKYIIMALNDYKPNRINRSLLNVNTFPSIPIQPPSYLNASIPTYRTTPTQINAVESNPRQLTSKQIYTINSIAERVKGIRRFNTKVSSDTFAKIPMKRTDWNKFENNAMVIVDNGPSRLFVDAGGPLQLQMREYFGPVDIAQMSIALYDDKGHLLDLNGVDWSCTLMVKCIYQY